MRAAVTCNTNKFSQFANKSKKEKKKTNVYSMHGSMSTVNSQVLGAVH